MLNKQIHETYLIVLLSAIFEDNMGNFLAFKGGTLAYLKHNLDRFSTDIDIDILDNDQEEFIIKSMREVLVKHGDIKNETLGKNLHRWIFRYNQEGMNIKIEVNKRVWTNNTYEPHKITNPAIRSIVTVPCMTKDCIFANKLVALSERFANRDLYDIYFFFRENFPINELLITERTGLSLKKFLQKLLKELPKNFTENSILGDLGEVLNDKQKSRVKKQLLKETTQQIKNFLASKN